MLDLVAKVRVDIIKPHIGQPPKLYPYQGKMHTMKELMIVSGLCRSTIRWRMKLGWSIEDVVERPLVDNKPLT